VTWHKNSTLTEKLRNVYKITSSLLFLLSTYVKFIYTFQHTREIKSLVLKTFKLCLKYFSVESIPKKNRCKSPLFSKNIY